MFFTRLCSSIVLVIIALFTIISGGPILLVTLTVISLIGLKELCQVEKLTFRSPLMITAGIGVVAYYGLVWLEMQKHQLEEEMMLQEYGMMCLLLILIALMMVYVFTYPKYRAEQVMTTFFGVVYVAVMLSYIYKTRMGMPEGLFIVWLIFICSWGCDTCAYCVGMLIGKHKLAPVLSPKKSIEGGIGGIAGAALLGFLFGKVMVLVGYASADMVPIITVTCAIGAVISQVGDLAASAIKRNFGLKDYGKLIPGHGGILDRFDSVIFTAPVVYYLVYLFL